jgi:uncharacterized protein
VRIQGCNIPGAPISAICGRYQVKELSLFGSAVRGDLTPESDLDLLVEFKSDARIGFLALAGMTRELSALLNRRVYLVPKDALKPYIREEILAQAEVLFAA